MYRPGRSGAALSARLLSSRWAGSAGASDSMGISAWAGPGRAGQGRLAAGPIRYNLPGGGRRPCRVRDQESTLDVKEMTCISPQKTWSAWKLERWEISYPA